MHECDVRQKTVMAIEDGNILLGRLRVTPQQMIGLVLGGLVCAFLVSAGVGLNSTLADASDKPITHPVATTRVSALNPSPTNNTLCSFIRQYKLHSGGKQVTVCGYQNRVRLDIRQFILGRPSNKGIVLNYDEYRSLDAHWPSISTFIIWLNRILKRDWSVLSQYKVVLRS